jgi:membrane protein
MFIAVSIAGAVFGHAAAREEVLRQVLVYAGAQGAQAAGELMGATAAARSGLAGAAAGAAALLFAATGLLAELQGALNDIWRVTPPRRPWLALLRRRALALIFVLGSGLLLLLSLALSAAAAALGKYLGPVLPLPEILLHALNFALMSGLTTLAFALVYKYLPDAGVSWPDVWTGAAFTSGLLTLGNLGLGLWLGKSGLTGAFGAAGPLILLLAWSFYCSQLLYFGAEFTRAHALRREASRKRKARRTPGG